MADRRQPPDLVSDSSDPSDSENEEGEYNFAPDTPGEDELEELLDDMSSSSDEADDSLSDIHDVQQMIEMHLQHMSEMEAPDDEDIQTEINYDRTLPSQHPYLGEISDVQGRTFLGGSVDERIVLPLFPMQGIVLFPGETLPLRVFDSAYLRMMEELLSADCKTSRTFGVVNISRVTRRDLIEEPERSKLLLKKLSKVGTTAEIRSMREEGRAMNVVTKGRQRFRVMKVWFDEDIIKAEVIIINDDEPTCFPSAAFRWIERGRPNRIITRSPGRSRHSVKNSHQLVAEMAAWPLWAYKLYDSKYLAQMAKQMFRELLEGQKPSTPQTERRIDEEEEEEERTEKEKEKGKGKEKEKEMEEDEGESDEDSSDDDDESIVNTRSTEDPVSFSFWLACNLPCGDDVRQKLLELNSAADRLRKEMKIMKSYGKLCCAQCDQEIGHKNDIFSMSLDGPGGSFVNPGGYVHQTITLRKAKGLNLVGEPCTEHSWFPGYAWTIAQCRSCGGHMGWRFTATKSECSPPFFWGLSRTNVSFKSAKEQQDQEH